MPYKMPKAKPDLKSLARVHTLTAVKTLAGIMAQPKAPESARVAAAQALLDRGWGKAEQKTETDLTVRQGLPSAETLSDAEWEARYGAGVVH